MKKLEDGKYEIRLSEDYLKPLGRARGGLDEDSCIQEAIEQFLALPEGKIHEETQKQSVLSSWPEGTDPRPYMVTRHIRLSDDLIKKFEPLSNYTDKSINAVIRLWLLSKGIKDLRP